MRSLILVLLLVLPTLAADPAFPKFKTQEIAKDLSVGYAVLIADINEDKKPDIVVVDTKRVIWYENPTWKVHTIITDKTKPDNVCITAHDIDGDGHLDIVIGAEWKPFNTKSGGTLQWLKRGKTLDEEWSVYPIGEEPTVHRIKMADIDRDGKPEILLGPLMGRESTQKANWTDGRPVRLQAYSIPKDPIKGPWEAKTISEDLHVMHNFHPLHYPDGRVEILAASYEGVSLIKQGKTNWETKTIGEGNQANPMGSRGASEIKQGALRNPGINFIATVEPWHGNQIVVYTVPTKVGGLWERKVIDEQLRWGHAVWCADLDGDTDGVDELIIGVRDNPAKTDKFTEKCGVRIYRTPDGFGEKWERMIIEDGGVAVEDLAAADLDGDRKIDIVAVGRATKNVRIYWNQGK